MPTALQIQQWAVKRGLREEPPGPRLRNAHQYINRARLFFTVNEHVPRKSRATALALKVGLCRRLPNSNCPAGINPTLPPCELLVSPRNPQDRECLSASWLRLTIWYRHSAFPIDPGPHSPLPLRCPLYESWRVFQYPGGARHPYLWHP